MSMPPKASESTSPQSSRRPSTTAKSGNARNSEKRYGNPQKRRRLVLAELGIDQETLDRTPKIAPLLRLCGISYNRIVDTLRSDTDPDSLRLVTVWDSLSASNQRIVGLDEIAVACRMTPRRVWELYAGAGIMQSREVVSIMIADALPDVMRVTIKDAKKMKGMQSREHLYKAARVLPTPKGSVTNINVGGKEAPQIEESGDNILESADEFLLKASRVMSPKQLPAQTVTIEVPEEDEEEDE